MPRRPTPEPLPADCPVLSAIDRRALRRAQWAVVLVLVALGLIQRQETFWPLVTWPVYDAWRSGPLPTQATTVELRVVTHDGVEQRLRSADLVEWSRERLATWPMDRAAASQPTELRTASRRYLVRLVAQALGDDRFDALEIWKLTRPADALALPPIDPATPPTERRVARFDVASPEVDR